MCQCKINYYTAEFSLKLAGCLKASWIFYTITQMSFLVNQPPGFHGVLSFTLLYITIYYIYIYYATRLMTLFDTTEIMEEVQLWAFI